MSSINIAPGATEIDLPTITVDGTPLTGFTEFSLKQKQGEAAKLEVVTASDEYSGSVSGDATAEVSEKTKGPPADRGKGRKGDKGFTDLSGEGSQ